MAAVPNAPEPTTQQVILRNISWDTYQRLLAERQDNGGARFAYDQGALEIMILSLRHERLKEKLMVLVSVIAEELALDIEGAGSTTFRREDLARGFEPDACYYITNAAAIRRKNEIDLTVDPPPELVIEVDSANPSLDKLPLMAGLGVAEVWRFDGARVGIFRLSGNGYITAAKSRVLPGVSSTMLNRLLKASHTMPRPDWLRLVREAVRG